MINEFISSNWHIFTVIAYVAFQHGVGLSKFKHIESRLNTIERVHQDLHELKRDIKRYMMERKV